MSDLRAVSGWRVDRAGRFFALAIGWTWIALGIAWVSGATATEPPASWLRLVAGIGPAIAAFVLVRRSESRDGRRRFWARVVDVDSVGWRWWLIIAAVSAGPGFAVWIVSSQHDLGVSRAAGVGGVIVFAVAASLAEEPGWRGYALDALRYRFWSAALMISVVWALWHVPLYGIEGTFQHDDVGFGTTFFWIIQAALLPQTILMIWILDHTRPSIAPAVVFHALVNISGEVLDYSTAQQALRLGLWVLLAMFVIGRRSRPRTQPGGDEY